MLILISIAPLFLSSETAKLISPLLYGGQFLIIFFDLIRFKTPVIFFSPSSITFFYISTSFTISSYAFLNGVVSTSTQNYEQYLLWNHYHFANFFFLSGLTLVHFCNILFAKKIQNIDYHQKSIPNIPKDTLFILIILTFSYFASFATRDLSLLGGSGDSSTVIKSCCAIALAFFMIRKNLPYRVFWYILIIAFFSLFSFNNKRDAIFLLIPFFIQEALWQKINFTTKHFLSLLITGTVALVLVVLMSITRGYGNFGANNVIEAVAYLPDYLQSPGFWSSFFNNIEVNYTFFHSNQAVEYILTDSTLISWGSTLIKAFLAPFPREVFVWKPQSIIDLYTYYHDPLFRAEGGSWPINSLAEIFWNFKFFSFLIIIPLYCFYNYAFLFFVTKARLMNIPQATIALYITMNFLLYLRGSGLDMYTIYIILAVAFIGVSALFCDYIFYTYEKLKRENEIEKSKN